MEEVWKDIKGYEGLYQVSNLGRIKSFVAFDVKKQEYIKREKILQYGIKKDGRCLVVLAKNGDKKTCRVHRLVAEAFIPNPLNKPCVNHIDNNPSNNNVSNLEWCTNKENSEWMVKQKRSTRIIKDDKVEKEILKDYIENKMKPKEIALKYKITISIFRGILRRNNFEFGKRNKYNVDKNELKKLLKQGLKNREIAKIIGCSSCLVATYKCRMRKERMI